MSRSNKHRIIWIIFVMIFLYMPETEIFKQFNCLQNNNAFLTAFSDAFIIQTREISYLTLIESSLDKHRIIGMGGALDSARFRTYLSIAYWCSPSLPVAQTQIVEGYMIPLATTQIHST